VSTYAAIGAVGLSLQRLLNDRLDKPPGTMTIVTVGNPPNEPDVELPIVNLFLYRVSLNGALANMPPRNRGDRGAYGHPPLASNLYYLLNPAGTTSAPGSASLQDEIVAHDLLGSAMRILNDCSILTPAIEASGGVQARDQHLLDADEAVKTALAPVSLEGLSK